VRKKILTLARYGRQSIDQWLHKPMCVVNEWYLELVDMVNGENPIQKMVED
jgi:hypothetical protein